MGRARPVVSGISELALRGQAENVAPLLSRGCASANARRRVACVLLRVLACRGCDFVRCVRAVRARAT